jgi:P27 family predicted phage terminase small subunit
MPPSGDVTGCPGDLDTTSKSIWKKTRNLIKTEGRWRPEYSLLLERYVRALERGRHCRARIAAREELTPGEGWFTTGSQRQLVQHPDVKTMREADRDAHDYATALLLTPASRAKMVDAGPTKPAGGKFDGAFG